MSWPELTVFATILSEYFSDSWIIRLASEDLTRKKDERVANDFDQTHWRCCPWPRSLFASITNSVSMKSLNLKRPMPVSAAIQIYSIALWKLMVVWLSPRMVVFRYIHDSSELPFGRNSLHNDKDSQDLYISIRYGLMTTFELSWRCRVLGWARRSVGE